MEEKCIVKFLRGKESYIRDQLFEWEGGYATDTGKWVIKMSDGKIKTYNADEDLLKATQNFYMGAT